MDITQEPSFGSRGTASVPSVSPKQFEFTGDTKTYFGIWIVNLLLSIITIGIYTAWAKVRRLRYFYGNTFLDGHNFEYHAKPKQILIGRIIVVAVLVVYNVLVTISPAFGVLLIPYLLAFPWILNKAMAFNARVTSYRNIRFNFEGTYWRALFAFVVMPILVIFTVGLLAPVASRLVNNYIGNGLSYGTAKFETDAKLKPLFANLGMTFLMMILAMLLFGALAAGLAMLLQMFGLFPEINETAGVLGDGMASFILGSIIGFYVAILVSYIFYAAGVRNIALNSTTLDKRHHFRSTVSRRRYTWIVITNLIAAVFTIGLLIPWGAIRSWRYLMNQSEMMVAGSLDSFIEDRQAEGTSAAAEYFDIDGIDFGL